VRRLAVDHDCTVGDGDTADGDGDAGTDQALGASGGGAGQRVGAAVRKRHGSSNSRPALTKQFLPSCLHLSSKFLGHRAIMPLQ
jgi:hypothetical protein